MIILGVGHFSVLFHLVSCCLGTRAGPSLFENTESQFIKKSKEDQKLFQIGLKIKIQIFDRLYLFFPLSSLKP
jgi:hypothetical protein